MMFPRRSSRCAREKTFSRKKTPPSGWPDQVKMLGGVPPLPQIRLNLERTRTRKGFERNSIRQRSATFSFVVIVIVIVVVFIPIIGVDSRCDCRQVILL